LERVGKSVAARSAFAPHLGRGSPDECGVSVSIAPFPGGTEFELMPTELPRRDNNSRRHGNRL
jgi:hypothetical protein